MKKLAIVIITLCLAWQSNGQTITLGVDANCQGFIRPQKQHFGVPDSTYVLEVPTGAGVTIKLVNPQKKDVLITIIGNGDRNRTRLDIPQEVFDAVNPISTDENMVLTVAGKSMDLKSPFQIVVACKDPAQRRGTVAVNFGVVRSAMQNVAAVNGVTATTGNRSDGQQSAVEPVYQPGSAVYDAIRLKDASQITEDDFVKIIKFYYTDPSILTPAACVDAVKDNPYLNDIFTSTYINSLQKAKNTIGQSTSDIFSNLSLSSIGGLDVTKFADGLAKFLVKRTKEELNIAFFTKFKEVIDKYPDIKTVFPKTYVILSAIGNEIYNYDQYIQNLREAFKDDIQSLADNLPSIIPNHGQFFRDHPPLKAALISGCYLASSLQKQVHPGDILANYPLEYLDSLENKHVAGAIQALQLLSASLRDTSSADSTYWVNIKYVRQLVDNRVSLRIYLGLVYQMSLSRYSSVVFDDKTTLADLLKNAAPAIKTDLAIFNQYKQYISRLADKTDNLNRMIKAYSKPANDSMAIELYKKYFDAFEDYFEYIVKVGELPLADKSKFLAGLSKELTPYFALARSASALVVDINRKNYSSAINNAVAIYDTVTSEIQRIAEARARDAAAVKSLDKKDPKRVDADTTALNAARQNILISDTRSSFMKYGSFMAAIATAKTSDDVAAAIEAAALPSGSARIKRESLFNISLNAYTGLFIGHESIDGLVNKTAFNAFGVTAPVGAALSWGHRLFFIYTGKHEWSTSLFLSVVDVGAIAAFRFKNDTASQVPTIELKNILSPGAFLSIGIPKSPLSVNFGAQMGPNLRKINFNSELPSNDSNNKIYWRFSASVCVDIPIFNLYTRSR